MPLLAGVPFLSYAVPSKAAERLILQGSHSCRTQCRPRCRSFPGAQRLSTLGRWPRTSPTSSTARSRSRAPPATPSTPSPASPWCWLSPIPPSFPGELHPHALSSTPGVGMPRPNVTLFTPSHFPPNHSLLACASMHTLRLLP